VRNAIKGSLRPLYQRLNSLWLFAPDGMRTPQSAAIRQANLAFDRIVDDLVQRRRASGENGDDVLGLLLGARDADGRPLSRADVRDELVTLLLAGHDTTAIALTWAFVLLAQAPAVEAELHAELDQVLGDRPATIADLPRLVFTRQVVDEVLRLYPPAWVIERTPRTRVTVAGERIGRGTTVVICAWVTQRDPRWFPEPDRFDPHRWDEPRRTRLPRYAYLPFGGGPRVCLGNTFALTEATLILATVAQGWRLALEPGQAIRPEPGITLRPNGRVGVRTLARGMTQRPGMAGALTAR
jgi:cytochrome P450